MDGIVAHKPSGHSRSQVTDAVARAAARHGVDFDYMLNVAKVESALEPTAQARTSSARGLYQFTTQTWLGTLDRHGAANGLGWAADAIGRDGSGRFSIADPQLRSAILSLRDDPAASAAMAAMLTTDNRHQLAAATGQDPEPVDLYLAHFLGSAGAAKFLSARQADPDQPAAPLMPAAAAANRSIFYTRDGAMRSLDNIRELFRAKLAGAAASGTAAQNSGSVRPPITMTTSTGHGAAAISRGPLQMLAIQPMPPRLSLNFAIDSYRRLAATGLGAA